MKINFLTLYLLKSHNFSVVIGMLFGGEIGDPGHPGEHRAAGLHPSSVPCGVHGNQAHPDDRVEGRLDIHRRGHAAHEFSARRNVL